MHDAEHSRVGSYAKRQRKNANNCEDRRLHKLTYAISQITGNIGKEHGCPSFLSLLCQQSHISELPLRRSPGTFPTHPLALIPLRKHLKVSLNLFAKSGIVGRLHEERFEFHQEDVYAVRHGLSLNLKREDTADDSGDSFPVLRVYRTLFEAPLSDVVEPCAPIVLRYAPFTGNPTFLLKPEE